MGWERRSLARLGGSLIDGAIIVTPTVGEARGGIPVVGAVLATEHLLGLGHRRIALLGGRADLESARLREEGFRKAMASAGVEIDETLVPVGGYRPETAEGPARELLSRPDRPTAIFAANDLSAIRTMEVAHELGLRVPEDLSVIGFDNIPESALAQPPLTTINQPLREIGAAALRILVGLLEGREPETGHLQLPTSMVERASCRALSHDG